MSSVKIAVRVRPFNDREKTRNAFNVIQMRDKTTEITNPENKKSTRTFTFDYSYWSMDSKQPQFASQDNVYNDLGKDMLQHAFDGYNTCIFAYGQTGSGKSYTMLGSSGTERGIIPRTCEELFERITDCLNENYDYNVEVSYFEIYCEKVKDLLNPQNKENLKVREHPALGPYVAGLKKMPVMNFKMIDDQMELGNKTRTVAATDMNAVSSRSHAVFTLIFTQKEKVDSTGVWGEKVSKISLVDLAGSERAQSTGATGDRLKEGAEINKSLTTLGRVIHALADYGKPGADKPPFRDSVLTYILKESLGGNSKTSMVAALSPADINYEETLGTLRFADRAKQIVCKALVNEDPNARMIRLLKEELYKLRQVIIQEDLVDKVEAMGINIKGAIGTFNLRERSVNSTPAVTPLDKPDKTLLEGISPEKEGGDDDDEPAEEPDPTAITRSPSISITAEAAKQQIKESEKLMEELTLPWKAKLEEAQKHRSETEDYMKNIGIAISVGEDGVETTIKGVFSPKNTPHLVNLNEDPLMSECLIYYIKEGKTSVGRSDNCDINLHGNYILHQHCHFENDQGKVRLVPVQGAYTFVNGVKISEPTELNQGFRVILGVHHVFRFNNPQEAKKARQSVRNFLDFSKDDYSLTKKTNPKENRRSHASSMTRGWNPNPNHDEFLGPDDLVMRAHSPTSDYPMSEYEFERERSYTPNSIITTYDYGYAQNEMLQGPEGERILDELVEEQTNTIKLELEEAKNELEDQKQQAENYKRMYDELMENQSVDGTSYEFSEEDVGIDLEPNYQNEQREVLIKCVEKWRDYRYNEIRDALYDNAVLLKEANSISVELRQQVAFQFVLMTDCPYAHLPEALALGRDCETDEPEANAQPDYASLKKTIVAVEVSDARHGVTYIWSLEKLRQRICAMHELYDACAKLETISPLIKACNLDDRSKDPVNTGNGKNPFFDRYPWYSLIGRSYVYLTHMLIPISLEQTIAIVTERGDVVGHIDVLVELCEDEDEETKDIKATTVAFEKTDSAWYPKDIPVYPYRQNDLIEQCYLGTDKLSEIIERPRKISSPPKLLGRSQSQIQKNTTPVSSRKRMSRHKSSEHGPCSSDLAISPREMEDIDNLLSSEGALRLTSSAREIRLLCDEDRFSLSENGSRGSVRSDIGARPLSSSAENLILESPHETGAGEDVGPEDPKSKTHPLQHSHTLLTEPQPSKLSKVSLDFSEVDETPINENRLRPDLSVNFNDLMSPTRLPTPQLGETFSIQKDGPPSRAGEDAGTCAETMSSSDYYSETSSFYEPNRISSPHLKIGRYVRVKVKILRVKNLDKNCANVLLQNRFLCENQEPYSSNIYANDGECCEVNHLHVYRIKVTLPFLEYIKKRGFMIEVFGHYEQHPLHFESTFSDQYDNLNDRRMSDTIPPVKSPAPSRSALTVPYQNLSSAQPVAKYDVIMNLQICELNPQGDYIPVPVTHVRETHGSFFLLQQGLQRRLVLSFVYDSNIELKMKKVKEVVVGRIRNQLKPSQEDEESSLTLNVSSAEFIDLTNDSRTVFRIQAAWDTSLHHTKLLNMSTPSNMLVFATMSVYLEMENCPQPACFTINFSLQITTRQQQKSGFRFWEVLFPSLHRPENNCVVGLYEVALKRTTENNARKRNPLFDDQSVYVRGEENLKGWKPRGISLIYEHQNQVRRLRDIEQVERAKHVLSIREKLHPGIDKVGASQPEDDLLNKCLYLWKFQISPFLEDHFTVEDLLKHPNAMDGVYGARSETPHRRCVALVHDISHRKSGQSVKRGYIQLSEYEGLWRKFYAVLKRPYIYLYYNDKDPIERDFINLATAKLQFNQDQLDAQTGVSVFSLCTKYRGFLCKTQDFEGWINALDPLTSGALVSKQSITRNNSNNNIIST